MSEVTVDIRVDLVSDHGLEELEESDVAAHIVANDAAILRAARSLDGVLRISSIEIGDELFSAVQRLCFEGAAALLVDNAIVDYRFFSSNDEVRLVANDDSIVISGQDVPEASFPRRPLIRALYECGARWVATIEQIGRDPEATHLRPFATAARAALIAAGLA
jgi:hypothetical protein